MRIQFGSGDWHESHSLSRITTHWTRVCWARIFVLIFIFCIFNAGMGGVTSAVSPDVRNALPIIGQSTRTLNMSGETAKFVKEAINKDSVVIFSKTYCPYCKMAKEVFEKLQHAFTAIELDKRDDGDTIQDVLGEITGSRTVPRVFVNGEFVGGGSDVKALYDAGKLERMLVSTGATS
ncbi:uncharacterized protein [Halyomorpha halys]|nr:glutaredoxin-C2 isoform X2 [Halyomorpha halys]XP_014272921.1 glutaredoxin-C2 isoform X2 [Halyomorpha halys]XP_014272922.1 glutaredoxin-C2 isoform X2 [Halyomorpha halys]